MNWLIRSSAAKTSTGTVGLPSMDFAGSVTRASPDLARGRDPDRTGKRGPGTARDRIEGNPSRHFQDDLVVEQALFGQQVHGLAYNTGC